MVAERDRSARRRRAAAISSILDMEAALQSERATVEAERRQYAAEAVKAFQARCRQNRRRAAGMLGNGPRPVRNLALRSADAVAGARDGVSG